MPVFRPKLPSRFPLVSYGLRLLFAFALVGNQSFQFQGSVPTGAASVTPLASKLDNAIQRGLQANLGSLVRETANQTTRSASDEESVATAADNLISASYNHNLAKASLARALGLAEQGIKRLIEVK
jgi:hypothetical protein